jgi:outer membrane protein assembly factor BamB
MKYAKVLGFSVLLIVLVGWWRYAGRDNLPEDTSEIRKAKNLPVTATFAHIKIKTPAHALTNNGRELVYATVDGFLYTLDPVTGKSKKLYDIEPDTANLLIGGLSHIEKNRYYYSSIHEHIIRRIDHDNGKTERKAHIGLADGFDLFDDKIYSITHDQNDTLTVYDKDGEKPYTLSTGIDDMVCIAHSDIYLYVLSEECNVFQVDAKTGKSRLVVRTEDNFERRDSFGGAEAIDIFKNHIYLSNVDDSSICQSDIDIRILE